MLVPTAILAGIAGVLVLRSCAMEGTHRDLVILGWSATVVNLSIPVAVCLA